MRCLYRLPPGSACVRPVGIGHVNHPRANGCIKFVWAEPEFSLIPPAEAPRESVDEPGAMGERSGWWQEVGGGGMTVNPAAAFVIMAIVVTAVSLSPGRSLAQSPERGTRSPESSEPSQLNRPRTRIRVTPRYPYRTESLPYPPPYPIEYPGPGYMRQCKSRLVQEARPSGTVIVQRMQCWWEPGQGQL
jgi:hypothetical protein